MEGKLKKAKKDWLKKTLKEVEKDPQIIKWTRNHRTIIPKNLPINFSFYQPKSKIINKK